MMNPSPTIGVLALQGDFAEHAAMLARLGATVREVRLPEELEGLDGLVLPGGESTTIGKLATDYGLIEPLRQFGQSKAIYGTCAGAIFLSKDAERSQPLLGIMDITVERNAYGRQVESFDVQVPVPALNGLAAGDPPVRAVFIRAPLIKSVSGEATSLASLPDGRIIAAQQGKLLATAFHPEISGDDRFHRYFLKLAES
ncbi:MAG TPA: pyridoxal 5'-phosphate synthase glutaminase subunit PdxT [Anaerolineales bacterium]|nr:pyridoxal 5'-phosphate synthase glutaminase subunit PdxT [Anaerolineales bacterium]HRQ92592.1 pyridoxal 5'-phosphate synthase glutaminase subunit PdxT [Anaerolineales bacterium]